MIASKIIINYGVKFKLTHSLPHGALMMQDSGMRIVDDLRWRGVETWTDKPLGPVSGMRTGGKAEFFCAPASVRQLRAVLEMARRHGVRTHVIGSLTNTLVSDEGVEGIVISTAKIRGLLIKGDLFTAYAGEKLDTVINKSVEHKLTGLERLGGIPGTVGGAVVGNAGANGLSISEHVLYMDIMTKDAKVHRLPHYAGAFGYRSSPIGDDELLLSVAFRLGPTLNTVQARQEKERYKAERVRMGQFRNPSLGCFFKNPGGTSAGKLIDEAGLKGISIGGAATADFHAGFIINKGNATSKDVMDLSRLIQDRVHAKTGIMLEREVRLLGDFS